MDDHQVRNPEKPNDNGQTLLIEKLEFL